MHLFDERKFFVKHSYDLTLLKERAIRKWIILQLLAIDIGLIYPVGLYAISMLSRNVGVQKEIKVLTIHDAFDVVHANEITRKKRWPFATIPR